eukprot:TRINITY_DN68015_c0_g1_i1.p1 TRINITY_DN68015_c0_g1~~TRINITY_DN68015_c0_g1_i1.p1  ORF type:complete len:488 (+),score=65.12 TRINITY_DN68015_c0_g1_i1:104-1567(+)
MTAADAAGTSGASRRVCNLCDLTFSSGNHLHAHLRLAHGAPTTAPLGKSALTFAYLGDAYHGSQDQPDVPTIEGVLWRAIATVDDDFKVAGLTRCARTDKGVHAVANVVGVSLKELSDDASRQRWVSQVNAALPDDIRLLGRQYQHGEFDARRWCMRRRYEYVMPYEALRSKAHIDEPLIGTLKRLKRLLKLFVGSHYFRRFTVQSEAYADGNGMWRNMLRIFTVGTLVMEGIPFVCVSICGQSFLQLQIRKMLGAVIGVMRGVLTPWWIHDALQPPTKAESGEQSSTTLGLSRNSAPTAPGFALYLAEAVFIPKANLSVGSELAIQQNAWSGISPAAAAEFRTRIQQHVMARELEEKIFVDFLESGVLAQDGDISCEQQQERRSEIGMHCRHVWENLLLQHETHRVKTEAWNSLETFCHTTINTLKRDELKPKLKAGERASLLGTVQETLTWLTKNKFAEKNELEARRKQLDDLFEHFLSHGSVVG